MEEPGLICTPPLHYLEEDLAETELDYLCDNIKLVLISCSIVILTLFTPKDRLLRIDRSSTKHFWIHLWSLHSEFLQEYDLNSYCKLIF